MDAQHHYIFGIWLLVGLGNILSTIFHAVINPTTLLILQEVSFLLAIILSIKGLIGTKKFKDFCLFCKTKI